MRVFQALLVACALYLTPLTPVSAQEDDKGFLTRTIQNALSGTGRTVSIDGFTGALSSEASFERMTISDDEGVWLTLEDVVLDWSRSALLRGRLEVKSLTAQRLSLPRLPVAEDTLPDAEAKPFSLPELPVAVQIETFSIAQIDLGPPILGEAAQLEINASATLNDDLADISLVARRTDTKRGAFVIEANLERSDEILDLLVQVSEGEGGIASRLLNIPGKPSVDLEIAGSGPLSAFEADVNVATDGVPRLAGQVALGTQTPLRASDTPDRTVKADIGGDITALLAPRYRAFFGEDLRLKIDALLEGNGAIEVSDFSLKAQAADLAGKVTLSADKWPTLIDITGQVSNPDGTAILLPAGGEGTTVDQVNMIVAYDQNDGDEITANFDISGLNHSEAKVSQTTLALNGTLQPGTGRLGIFAGEVSFAVQGLDLRDPALAEAVGQRINGRTMLSYTEDQPIEISDLALEGTDYALTGRAVVHGIATGLKTELSTALTASDLSRFSALAGREIDGQTELALEGEVSPLGGQFDLRAKGSTQDLALGITQVDPALAGRTELSLAAKRDETGTFLRDLVLENTALSLTGSAALRTDDGQAQAEFLLNDITLVLPQYEGPVSVNITADQDVRGWTVAAATGGPYGAELTLKGLATGPNAALDFTADVPNVKPFARQIDGPVTAQGTLRKTKQGWRVETDATAPYNVKAALNGPITPALDLDFDLSVPNIEPLVPQVSGALRATGNVQQTDAGIVVDTNATGPYGIKAAVQGLATGPDMNIDFDVSMPDVRPLVPGVSGPLSAIGTVRQSPQGIMIDTTATGPYAARAAVQGLATGPDMRLNFEVSVPNVRPVVPSISGPLSARGEVRQTTDGIVVDTTASGPYSLRAAVEGLVTGPNANVTFSADMPNIGALVDNINGPLSVDGSARKEGGGWRVQTDADGPSGTQAAISGLVRENGNLDLGITGSAPLGLTRPFLEPRDLQGQAQFDLRINGQPALSSVTGTIRTGNASLSAPNLRVALQDINADIRLGGSRAQVNVTGQAVNGGSLRVGGSIALTGGSAADLQIALDQLVLIDPKLYRTSIDGALQLDGPLAGGARISGQIGLGETNVTVPSTGLTSIGDIPPIKHIGATRPVIATRRKAGIDSPEAGADPTDSRGSGYGLNIRVSAPNRIFVRGRGLDAELGGGLRLTGTTKRIISAGRFDLQRGRLDILGKRFDLREGAIQFQGDLVPFIRFVTATSTSSGEVRVVVEGPVDAPKVTFEATPEAPQDEVLAQLLFGRNLSEISAIQALQLANAVATLAGRGGSGVISNLREGFGLDDLDVATTDDGATAVRAGKYLSENVYTDVTAASDGTGEISLNLDITPNLKGKATLESDGNSGIGIFFEKDY